MQTTLTSKRQVTIPRDVRQLFGLRQGMAISFTVEGDHFALRPACSAREAPMSGFGLIQSHRPDVPVDLDIASLAVDAP